jgi:hypothetical protein
VRPSGANATLYTAGSGDCLGSGSRDCLGILSKEALLIVSHTRIVPSLAPDTKREPSGENAMELTDFVWPSKVRSRRPVATSHSLMVKSELAVAKRAPSGENATDCMASLCGTNATTSGLTVGLGASCACAPESETLSIVKNAPTYDSEQFRMNSPFAALRPGV